MPLRFSCPACAYGADVPDEYSGAPLRCPQCGAAGGAPAAATRPCPFCAEDIRPAARVCRHCGEVLDRNLAIAKQKERVREVERRRSLVLAEVPGSRAAFVCAVLSIVSAPGILLGVLLGSTAILLGAAAVRDAKRYPDLEGLQRAKLAVTLGAVGIVASLLVLALLGPRLFKGA